MGTHFFFALQELFGRTCVRRVRATLAYREDESGGDGGGLAEGGGDRQGQLLAETSADGVLELTNGLAVALSVRTDGGGLAAGGGEDTLELRIEYASAAGAGAGTATGAEGASPGASEAAGPRISGGAGETREELVLEGFTRLVHRRMGVAGAPTASESESRTIVRDGGYGETESILSLAALARREDVSGVGMPISAAEGRNAQRVLDAITASEGEWLEGKYE